MYYHPQEMLHILSSEETQKLSEINLKYSEGNSKINSFPKYLFSAVVNTTKRGKADNLKISERRIWLKESPLCFQNFTGTPERYVRNLRFSLVDFQSSLMAPCCCLQVSLLLVFLHFSFMRKPAERTLLIKQVTVE